MSFHPSTLTVSEDAIESFLSVIGRTHGVDAHPHNVTPSSLSSAFHPSFTPSILPSFLVSFDGTLRYFLSFFDSFLHLFKDFCSRPFREIYDVIDLRGKSFSVGVRRFLLLHTFVECLWKPFHVRWSFEMFSTREVATKLEDAELAELAELAPIIGQASQTFVSAWNFEVVLVVVVVWVGLVLLIFLIWWPEAAKISVSGILKRFY